MKRKRQPVEWVVFKKTRMGLVFHIPAWDNDHAKRQVKALVRDFKASARKRVAFEIIPGHIGVGALGIESARNGESQ
jgi:hypothetical protein